MRYISHENYLIDHVRPMGGEVVKTLDYPFHKTVNL